MGEQIVGHQWGKCAGEPQSTGFIGIRTRDTAASLVPSIGDALRRMNGDIGLTLQPLEQQVQQSMAEDRLLANLSSVFAGLGLILSMLGLYGVAAYATARQRREFSIRIALGASPFSVVERVFRRVGMLVFVGVAFGVLGSAVAAALVRSLLFGVNPRDPVTLAISALLLMGVAGVAVLLPSYRAATADPAAIFKDA